MTAWYLSIAAEAWLAVACRWTPWGWFLAFDLIRTGGLLYLPSRSAENAQWWLATLPASIALQVWAVAGTLPHGARTSGGLSRGLLGAGGLGALLATALLLAQDAPAWGSLHHAMATAHRFVMVILLAALMLSIGLARFWRGPLSDGALGMAAYYSIELAAIVAIGWIGPEVIRPVNTWKAVALAVLFGLAAGRRTFRERTLGGTDRREQ